LCCPIVGVSILFLVAWAYPIVGRPSVFCGATGLSLSCPGVSVGRDEEKLMHMISW
jgi:hypothetical protein